MADFIANNQLAYAIFGGILPALAWLVFWLKGEDPERREPRSLIALTFIIGMIAVLVVVPIEKGLETIVPAGPTLVVVWATVEEIIKFLAVMLLIRGHHAIDEPMDYAMYLIAGALGFAGLENILFLMNPEVLADSSVGLLTGNLRFLGSTLLHSLASGFIGICLGLSYYMNWYAVRIYTFIGIVGAVVLHSVFNLFIMNEQGPNFFRIFGFLWVVTIISLLLFEKLRRMGEDQRRVLKQTSPAFAGEQ